MKYKIEKENRITNIYDSKGNEVYWEDSEYGYWEKRKFDKKGNEVYWENSDGKKWETPKSKEENIIQAKDLDDCLKKLKESEK